MLTPRQAQLLDYIRAYAEAHNGVTPSYDEMMKALGLRSKSGIHRIVDELEGRRVIRRLPHAARSIQILTASDERLVEVEKVVRRIAQENTPSGDGLALVRTSLITDLIAACAGEREAASGTSPPAAGIEVPAG